MEQPQTLLSAACYSSHFRTLEPSSVSAVDRLRPELVRALVNATSSGAISVTPSPADGKMPASDDPAMAVIAAVRMVKPVSVVALARPAWKVVMHCAYGMSPIHVHDTGEARQPDWVATQRARACT